MIPSPSRRQSDATSHYIDSDLAPPIRRRPQFPPELPGQLTVKTSSSKKRKLARPPPATRNLDSPSSPSPDTTLLSCEPDDDPALSFSAHSAASGLDSPLDLRADSLPASSLPPWLQTQAGSLVSADYASSVASSSPGASAYAELSLESDRGGEEAGPAPHSARSQSPLRVPRRAIMNGDAELPHRSSSPLKRRASSMEPGAEAHKNGDAEMGVPQPAESDGSSNTFPRAMSVDAPETNGHDTADNTASQRKSHMTYLQHSP